MKRIIPYLPIGYDKNKEFQGKFVNSMIETNKLDAGKKVRVVFIADFHGYTNNPERARRYAEAIKAQNPDFVLIGGDLFNSGSPWEGGNKYENLKEFLRILGEQCPVFITLGNHDLRGLNPKNHDKRRDNFKALADIKNVYPLYNESVVVNGMEFMGCVAPFEMVEGKYLRGLSRQKHGLAHDEFIPYYNEHGAKFQHPELLTHYLGHAPHLINVSENGIGLGDLVVCDIFWDAHLHNGYYDLIKLLKLDNLKFFKEIFEYDGGLVERWCFRDKNGKIIWSTIFPVFFFGKSEKCRGNFYFGDNAQNMFFRSPDGTYYLNMSTEPNVHDWIPINRMESALKMIDQYELHAQVISEGVEPLLVPSESMVTSNVVDIVGREKKLILK